MTPIRSGSNPAEGRFASAAAMSAAATPNWMTRLITFEGLALPDPLRGDEIGNITPYRMGQALVREPIQRPNAATPLDERSPKRRRLDTDRAYHPHSSDNHVPHTSHEQLAIVFAQNSPPGGRT